MFFGKKQIFCSFLFCGVVNFGHAMQGPTAAANSRRERLIALSNEGRICPSTAKCLIGQDYFLDEDEDEKENYSYKSAHLLVSGLRGLREMTPEQLETLVARGDAGAQYEYGNRLLLEEDPAKYEQAISLIKQSVDQNFMFAQQLYSTCLHDGIGVEKNPEEAKTYLELAKKNGSENLEYWYKMFLILKALEQTEAPTITNNVAE
jgi:hypothetical protein